MAASKAADLIRLFFAQIDRFIYWLISIVYSIIEDLSSLTLFSDSNIQDFAKRIYVFLGIIMLFKTTFSLINYLIDPDMMNDKTKGAGNIVKNIIITLFLIIIVPYGFNFLYSAQSAIINDNLIPKLILGTSDTETTSLTVQMDTDVCGTDVHAAKNYGNYLSLVTLRPFIQVYEDANVSKNDLISKLDNSEKDLYCKSGSTTSVLNKRVLYADTMILNLGEYIFDYSFFMSTAFGALVLLLLLNFCFDIAMRAVKLGFLEIIAPIPIISYIDPKSGKDGAFKKWFKEVINTWAGLFIRLAVIYFAIYAITIINTRLDELNLENGKIVMLFLIVGALMFAKQAIPLIENIFGIKFNHTVQLNPFKKISDQALGGKQVLGAMAGTVAGATAGLTNLGTRMFSRNTWRDRNGDLSLKSVTAGAFKTAGSTIGGLASGAYRGFNHASSDGKVFKGAKEAHLEAMFAKQQREDLGRQGSTAWGRFKADAARYGGVFNQAQQNVMDFAARENQLKNIENSLTDTENQLKRDKEKSTSGYKEYSELIGKMNDKINSQKSVKDVQEAIDSIKNSGNYYDDNGRKTTIAENLEAKLKAEKKNSYEKIKDSVDMKAWQERLTNLVDTEENLRGYNRTGFKDGLIDKEAKFAATSALSAAEVQFIARQQSLDKQKQDLAEKKHQLAEDKMSYEARRADADNAARKTKGGQPEGWKPNPDSRIDGPSGYGPGYGPLGNPGGRGGPGGPGTP